jgi:hypothetical protein
MTPSALLAIALTALAPAQSPAPAPPSKPPATKTATPPTNPNERAQFLHKQSLDAIVVKDYAAAEAALRELVKLQPSNFVVYYNLACVRSLRGDAKEAGELLVRAVETGFTDIRQMQRDTMLDAVRDDPNYLRIVENWTAIADARIDANLKQAQDAFKGAYTTQRDPELRLAYLSAFEEQSFADARDEMTRLARWADEFVMPGILDPELMKKDAWAVVILPTRGDFTRWANTVFGANAVSGFSAIGGSYDHDLKRLVAQDLGPTLRHEFFHVLHWRSISRLGQAHPIWVHEGLCSLVEDYDILPGKDPEKKATPRLEPATSWRTNTVKRMERAGVLPPIKDMVSKTHEQFQGARRMGLYAQARAVFLYLWQQGKLKDWYEHYTEHHAEDPSGLRSLCAVLNVPQDTLEKDFKAWVRALPEVPEEVRPGMATLGVEVDVGKGEGPTVVSLPRRSGLNVTPGDILVAIDDRPTRDLPELLRILGTLSPGQTVKLTYRRGKIRHTDEIVLVPAR